MADLTTDNADDIIRNTLKFEFDDIKNRLSTLENIVREDLAVDKNQKSGNPESDRKIETIYQRVEELRAEINDVQNNLHAITQMLTTFIQKYEQTQDRFH